MRKRLLAVLCAAIFLSFGTFSLCASANGNGNIDGGGGGMGDGTSQSNWVRGNDGVRITVVDAETSKPAASSVDFSNKSLPSSLLHFGKVSKIQYRSGAALSFKPGRYTCLKPGRAIPTIVTADGNNNIPAIKKYFCSQYAVQMVADATGISYERMISGRYKILIEPLAYFKYNGIQYCMSATEAALYDQLAGGDLKKQMGALTHQNLPLSLFLERSDLGFPAWSGPTSGNRSNADIINQLGVGIVWFNGNEPSDGGGAIEGEDVTYRVNTDVITSVTLQADTRLTPDNPAAVTFQIGGTTYYVRNIVIPAGDSQTVWVKWHTPSTPQDIPVHVTVSGAYVAQDAFTAHIVDLNQNVPPDPKSTDSQNDFTSPPLPSSYSRTTANWGIWSCHWEPNWVWHSNWVWAGNGETGYWYDAGEWVDEGDWEYDYAGYSASLSGSMSLLPDDMVPSAEGKTMKSGYGVKTAVSAGLSANAPASHITEAQTANAVFPEFQYQTYNRLLERTRTGLNSKFEFQKNAFSTYNRRVHFTPLWYPNEKYTVSLEVLDVWTPDGMLYLYLNDAVEISGSLYDDWYTNRE